MTIRGGFQTSIHTRRSTSGAAVAGDLSKTVDIFRNELAHPVHFAVKNRVTQNNGAVLKE
jgi:hypothetical protein